MPEELIPIPAATIADYYYVDPAEDQLHGPLVIYPFPLNTPEYTTVGFKNQAETVKGTPAYQAAQVWGTMATTLNYIMNLNNPPYLKGWAETYNLVAIPRAGYQLNAYYDRSSLRFFAGKDPTTNNLVFTCESAAIVAHELGHAILDAIRPDLWNTAVMECASFHEAFGDIIAILVILQHEPVIKQLLIETSSSQIPNLWQSNFVSELAEQLGHAVHHSSNMKTASAKYLRNIYNDFKYTDPSSLPTDNTDKTLSQEPHNFSRVFSGAWYECFCELFAYYAKNKIDLFEAVKQARDAMAKALFDTLLVVPSQLHFFQAVSTTMLDVLKKQQKLEVLEIVTKVFKRRGLDRDGILTNISTLINTVTVDHTATGNSMYASLAPTQNLPAQTIKAELPQWVALVNGKDPVRNVGLKETLTISVNVFLNYAINANLVGRETDNNMFAITNEGKFIRNYICSAHKEFYEYL